MNQTKSFAILERALPIAFCLAIATFVADIANAASLKVLWYGQNQSYNTKISELAAAASTYDPWGDGSLTWDLTIWNPSDPAPNFAEYDVLAIGAGVAIGSANEYLSFDRNGILNNKAAIEIARGSRTFISGQDADSHYHLGKAGNRPGTSPDGPFGFLVDAVNWAGSGTGMGIVALTDGWYPYPHPYNRRWWLDDRSFLKAELEGYVSYFLEEDVVIPTATLEFPVNEGLTTPGLSNWRQSAHAAFDKNIPGYLSINDAGNRPGFAVTIVTASEADGGTLLKSVPEPSSAISLLGIGAVGASSLLKRKRQMS